MWTLRRQEIECTQRLGRASVYKHQTKFLLEQVFPTFSKKLWSDANFYHCNRWNTKKRNRGELRVDIATADPAKLSFGPDFSTLDWSCRCWNFKLSLSIHASAKTDYWFIVNLSWPLHLYTAYHSHREARIRYRVGGNDCHASWIHVIAWVFCIYMSWL